MMMNVLITLNWYKLLQTMKMKYIDFNLVALDINKNITINRAKFCNTQQNKHTVFIWLFTSQSTIFQLCRGGSSWVERVLSKAQGHNTVTPVRLEPAAPWSRVQHSTTEALCSHKHTVTFSRLYSFIYWKQCKPSILSVQILI